MKLIFQPSVLSDSGAQSDKTVSRETFWYDWRTEGPYVRNARKIVFSTKSFVRFGEKRLGARTRQVETSTALACYRRVFLCKPGAMCLASELEGSSLARLTIPAAVSLALALKIELPGVAKDGRMAPPATMLPASKMCFIEPDPF